MQTGSRFVVHVRTPKIAYYGDSFTAGQYGGGVTTAYPGFVYGIDSIPYTNYALGGTTVNQGGIAGSNLISRYQLELNLGYTGQYVVFMYGYNDGSYANAQFKSDYKTILQAYITAGFPLDKIILCIQPRVLPAIRTYLNEIASELGVILYDSYALFEAIPNYLDTHYVPGDLHPNNTGQLLIATGLEPLIRREIYR